MILHELGAEEKGKTEWSASDRRIMTTWIVARAFERLKKTPRDDRKVVPCGWYYCEA